ncbi:MAG: DUF4964 domain-containing protein [Acutalibacteraceae bacterium]
MNRNRLLSAVSLCYNEPTNCGVRSLLLPQFTVKYSVEFWFDVRYARKKENDMKLPCYPLVTIDPFMSIWSKTEQLYAGDY